MVPCIVNVFRCTTPVTIAERVIADVVEEVVPVIGS